MTVSSPSLSLSRTGADAARGTSLMATVLTRSASAESFADVAVVRLSWAELRAVAGAVPARRSEFSTARHCARRALVELGAVAVPLPPDRHRLPQWPAGVVGSVTHCAGYRGAAVAWRHEVQAVGIDAEPHAALPEGVAELVLGEDERTSLASLVTLGSVAAGLHAERIAFCAKEAVYKAWFPPTRRWLEFTDVAVTVRRDGTFRAQLLVPDACAGDVDLSRIAGRWTVANGLVLTAVEIPRDRSPRAEVA